MAKRVYSESIKKWAIKAGIPITTIIIGIFLYLSMTGAITVNGYSGDMNCAGTIEDPCYAYINFTANEDIFIYPTSYDPWGRNTEFEFEPGIESWKLQRSWGSSWRNLPLDKVCTGTWCGLSNSKDTRKFSVAFRKGRDYNIRIIAYKKNPSDVIKWSAFNGEIDPYWLGIKKEVQEMIPVGLRANKVIYTDGSITTRYSTIQNLWNYKDDKNSFHVINMSFEEEINETFKKEYKREKGVMKITTKSDGKKNDFISVIPSFDKNSNEKFDISVSKIVFNEEEINIDLSKKNKENSITRDFGNILVSYRRNGLRTMVKANNSVESFRIEYTLSFKKMKIVENGNEYWIYSDDDEFRMRIRDAKLLDTNMSFLLDHDGALLDFVDHSLIDNKDGTYTYVKESNNNYDPSKLPEDFLIDGDIYYSSTADGKIKNRIENSNWDTVHSGTTGTNVDDSSSSDKYAMYVTENTFLDKVDEIHRGFFYFDTSGATNPIAVNLSIYGYYASSSSVSAQEGTQADTLTTADYDSCSPIPSTGGGEYGHVVWSSISYNTISFNQDGIDDINISGVTKICTREYTYDYLDSIPSGMFVANGCYFAEEATTAKDPYLEITEGASDTCTCAGLNTNWEIDMSDNCNITDNCNLGTGKLSFTGSGYMHCNATINTTDMGDPGATGVLWIDSVCIIDDN